MNLPSEDPLIESLLFVAFPWVETSTGPGGFMICVFLIYDGNSRRLNRKWFYGEAGNRTCNPWFTRHSAYLLHHAGFFKARKAWPTATIHYENFKFSENQVCQNH